MTLTDCGSVYGMVIELCKLHLSHNCSKLSADARHLLRLKNCAYEALLKSYHEIESEAMLPVDHLLAYSFKLKINGKHLKAAQLENKTNLLNDDYANELTNIQSILTFLYHMRDSKIDAKSDTIACNFSSISTYKNTQGLEIIYPDCPPIYGEEFAENNLFYMHYPCDIFESIDDNDLKEKDPTSCSIFELQPGMNNDGNQLSCVGHVSDSPIKNDLFGGLHHSLPKGMNINFKLSVPELSDDPNQFYDFRKSYKRPYRISQTSEAISEDEGIYVHDASFSNYDDIWDKMLVEPNYCYEWESIGKKRTSKLKPFISEAGPAVVNKIHLLLTKELLTINPSLLLHIPDPIYVKTSDLIPDILNALVGVPSSNFIMTENVMSFRAGVHIHETSPDSTSSLMRDILYSANNFIKLSNFSSSKSSIQYKGLISSAFCAALAQYLTSYQVTVLNFHKEMTLMELRYKLSKLMNQINFLSKLCLIDNDRDLPTSVELLSYLYRTAVDNWHSNNYPVLLFLLNSSCRPYFRFLQEWLFEGICDDVCGDYMIYADDMFLNSRDRSYWTHGYVLLQSNNQMSNVPVFLEDVGKDIFLCGKTLNLLKLCNPKHYLCKVDQNLPPDLKLIFSNVGLKQLDEKCSKYRAKVTYLGQQSNSTREQNLRMEEEDKKQQALLARHHAEQEAKKITNQKLQQKKILYEKKKKELDALKFQMEESIARKKMEQEEKACKSVPNESNAEEKQQTSKINEKPKFMPNKSVNEDFEVKLRHKSVTQVDDTVCRMSITEDDDGHLNFNLNDVKSPKKTIAQFRSSENVENADANANKTVEKIDNLTDMLRTESNNDNDIVNSNYNSNYENILKEDKDTNQMILNKIETQNEYNDLKSSKTQARSTVLKEVEINNKNRNCLAHPSDSTIQDLIYGENGNICDDKVKITTLNKSHLDEEGNFIKVDASKNIKKDELNLSNKQPLSNSSEIEVPRATLNINMKSRKISKSVESDSKMKFSYQKTFPELDSCLDPIHMNKKLSQNNSIETENDIDTSLNVPLSILIQRSLLNPVYTQASLVNRSILDYFMIDLKINEHFKALRNYLFFYDGEFGHLLSEQLFNQLSKCSGSSNILNPIFLNNLLSQSLVSSMYDDTAYSEKLSFLLKSTEIPKQSSVLSLLNVLQLNYQVSWPINIIITEKDIMRYNKVFNFIMQIKLCLWTLNEIFFYLKEQSVTHKLDCSHQFRRLQIFRYEIQHFAGVLQSYIVNQVLQITWHELQEKLKNLKNFDDLRHAHSSYLNKACFRCLVNEKAASVFKVIQNIFDLILKFHFLIVNNSWEVNPESGEMEHTKFQELTSLYKIFRGYAEFLCKVLKMLAERGYQPHLNEFLLRLDLNNHYWKEK